MVAGQPVALGPRGETRAIPTGQPPIRPHPQSSVARLVHHFHVITGGGGAQFTVGSGLNDPTGVAVDGAGDVFIADSSNNRVVEVPYLGNGTYGTQTDVPRLGLHGPQGVAVDGAGDVFIADFGNSRVVEVPYLGNGTYGTETTVGSGLNYPRCVAVDG